MTPLFWSNVIALVVGTLAGGAFLFRYLLKVRPRLSEQHRMHVVAFSAIVWVFYALYTYRYLSDPADAPGVELTAFNLVRGGLFWVLTLVVVWRWLIFERGLMRERRRIRLSEVPST